jgi:hypothetical protein
LSETKPGAAAVRQGCLKVLLTGVLAVAALYVLGLWLGRDPWAGQGVPVTAPTSGTAKPTPTTPEPEHGGIEEVKYDLHERVLAWSGVQRPTEVDCEIEDVPDSPRTFGCTVTYDGTEVPFTIRITDVTKALGMALFEWEIAEQKAVLTKEGVFAEFWRQGQRAGYSEMRCDEDIPTKKVVEVGPTSHFCYYRTERGDHHRARVTVGEHSLQFLTDDEGEKEPKTTSPRRQRAAPAGVQRRASGVPEDSVTDSRHARPRLAR